MSIGRRMVTGALWGQVGQMASLGLATVLQIILARGLGTDRYGTFAAVNGVVYLAVALASGGAAGTLNSHLTKLTHQHGPAAAAYLFWRLWAWRIVIFASITLAVTLFSSTAADLFLKDPRLSGLIVAAAFYMFTIGMFQVANMLFFGLLLTKWAVIGQAMSVAANVAIATVMIARDATLTELTWALAAGQALVCAAQLARGWSLVKPGFRLASIPDVARTHVSGLWRFSLAIWGVNLLTQALGKQTDIVSMQAFGIDPAEIGFYNLGITLGLTANVIFTRGVGQVAIAGLSSIAVKSPEKIGLAWRALCSVANVFALPLLVFVGVCAHPIVTSLYGHEFADAAIILQIYAALAIPGQMLGGGSHTSPFIAMGMPRRTLQARGVAGVTNVAVNLALIPLYGARGAMFGTGLCSMASAFYEYKLLNRYLSERLPWVSYARAGAAIVPALIPAWLLAPHFGVIGVLVAGGLFLGIYGAMLLVIRPVSVDPEVARSMPAVARKIVRIEAARPRTPRTTPRLPFAGPPAP